MSILALDTETTGLDLRNGCKPFMVTACNDEGQQFVWEWPVDVYTRQPKINKKDIKQIEQVIRQHNQIVFHHYKFDYRALVLAGVNTEELEAKWEDTLLAAHVVNSTGSHALKDLCSKYLGISTEDEKILRKEVTKARSYCKRHHPDWNVGADVGCDYWLPKAVSKDNLACETYGLLDVERTLFLWLFLSEEIEEQGLWPSYNREKQLLPTVRRIEDRGISLINESLEAEQIRYRKKAVAHEKSCIRLATKVNHPSINIRSWQQVQKVMKDGFQWPISGTDVKTLSALLQRMEDRIEKDNQPNPAITFLWHLLENRQNLTAAKYLTNYNELKLKDADGIYRLHPSMHQTGTSTTRFSHTNPNNANVGKGEDDDKETGEEGDFKLRSVFGPGKFRVWYPIDYQQLQLRIFAYSANDTSMIRAFERGYNFHEFIASKIFKCEPEEVTKNQKRIGKNVNFGFIFGASPAKIEATAGMSGLWDTVVSLFPKANEFMQMMIKIARKQGFIKTAGGYKLKLPLDKHGRLKAYAATNYYVQGTEGDIVKNSMIELDATLNTDLKSYNTYMTMQVHDELVFDAPQLPTKHERALLQRIKEIMEGNGAKLGIITPVNISKATTNWADAQEIQLV